MNDLPEPHFIDRDPAQIRAECIAKYETDTERTLVPSQFEAQLIELIAYRESLLRIAIQDAAKQNLSKYARFPMIDHLCRLVGVERLEAQPARTTMRFALEAPLGVPTPIQEGTRVRTKDGRVIFATEADVVIPAGETEITVGASALTLGPLANGYIAGQVVEIIDTVDAEITATNLTTTTGGAAAEDSDRMRERLPLAVRSLSVAGPEDAYIFHAKSAHPDVQDVSVSTPEPGVVLLTILARDGEPSQELLDLVVAAVSSRGVRPLCDTVQVQGAVPVDYALEARLTLRRGAPIDATIDKALEEALDYVEARAARLGLAPDRSQIIGALGGRVIPGVFSVELVEPGAIVVPAHAWARCTNIDVQFAGFAVRD